jgi:hypothetical protein
VMRIRNAHGFSVLSASMTSTRAPGTRAASTSVKAIGSWQTTGAGGRVAGLLWPPSAPGAASAWGSFGTKAGSTRAPARARCRSTAGSRPRPRRVLAPKSGTRAWRSRLAGGREAVVLGPLVGLADPPLRSWTPRWLRHGCRQSTALGRRPSTSCSALRAPGRREAGYGTRTRSTLSVRREAAEQRRPRWLARQGSLLPPGARSLERLWLQRSQESSWAVTPPARSRPLAGGCIGLNDQGGTQQNR